MQLLVCKDEFHRDVCFGFCSTIGICRSEHKAGRNFWGPNVIITKSLTSFRAAVAELRALVARQAAVILRLLNHLANPGGGAAPAAIAAGSATAPAALARPASPADAEQQPSPPMLGIAVLRRGGRPRTAAAGWPWTSSCCSSARLSSSRSRTRRSPLSAEDCIGLLFIGAGTNAGR